MLVICYVCLFSPTITAVSGIINSLLWYIDDKYVEEDDNLPYLSEARLVFGLSGVLTVMCNNIC